MCWWSQAGSNRRPPACHAGALPAELWPRRWKPERIGWVPNSVKLFLEKNSSQMNSLDDVVSAAATAHRVKATLIKYRRRHDAWKARRVCCVARGRLVAVLPSRAAQPAGLPGITPSFSIQSVGASPVCPHAFGPSSRQTARLPSPTALWPANRQGW